MRGAVSVFAGLSVLAPVAVAWAQTDVNLRLDAIPSVVPSTLTMRVPALQRRRGARAVAVADRSPARAKAAPAPAPANDAAVSGGFDRVPTSWRDLEERVIFRFNLGYRFDQAPASGDVGLNGAAPDQVFATDGAGFREGRQFVLGDLAVGTRGVLTSSLNTYLLANYQFDTDGATTFSSLTNAYDSRSSGAVLVKAGYAEMEGLPEISPALDGLFVRAGRQFHYGAALFVTHFDGLQARFATGGVEVGGFFGRRVSLYLTDDGDFERIDLFGRRKTLRNSPGLLGGANLTLRGQDLFGIPADVDVEYLFFSGGGDLDINSISLSRQYLELSSRVKLPASWRLYIRARLAQNGDRCAGQLVVGDGDTATCAGTIEEGSFGLGRLSAQLRMPFGRKLLARVDLEQLFDGEVAYDFISPNAADVVNVANQIGFGLTPPSNTTRVGARVSYAIQNGIELYGFARAQIAADSTSGFNENFEEIGGAAAATVGNAINLLGQYKLRLRQIDDATNQVGSQFFDTSGSGVDTFHELSAEALYNFGFRNSARTSAGSYRKATVGAGAYIQVYGITTPYVSTDNDSRMGARFTGNYWLNDKLRVHAAGEVAEASPTFAGELGTIVSVRGMVEARF